MPEKTLCSFLLRSSAASRLHLPPTHTARTACSTHQRGHGVIHDCRHLCIHPRRRQLAPQRPHHILPHQVCAPEVLTRERMGAERVGGVRGVPQACRAPTALRSPPRNHTLVPCAATTRPPTLVHTTTRPLSTAVCSTGKLKQKPTTGLAPPPPACSCTTSAVRCAT